MARTKEFIDACNELRKEWAENDAKRDQGIVPAKNIRMISDIPYTNSETEDEKVWHLTDIYYPEDYNSKDNNSEATRYPVIVSIHGGGWFYGDKELYHLYTKYLASKGFAVVNFNYRLAPEYAYPSTFYDVCYLMDFVAKNADKYKLDMNRFYVVGDSCGAQLASQYSVFATSKEYRVLLPDISELVAPVPCKVALNCGIYEMNYEADKMICDWYFPEVFEGNLRKSLFNILDYMNGDFPETYLMVSINDGLMPRTEVMRKKLEKLNINHTYREFGYRDKNDSHVFHLNMKSEDGIKCNQEEIMFFNM